MKTILNVYESYKRLIYQHLYIQIMEQCCGARNTLGFTYQLMANELPAQTHLTYQGVFNQLKFNVGPKTNKLIDLSWGYSRFQFQDSKFDNSMNEYLALFLKSKNDGQDRSQSTNMNISLCLDVSGSMALGLGGAKDQTNRLSLSIEAIRMLISKLKSNDSISLIIFDDQAQVVFDQIKKSDLKPDIYERLECIFAEGGTSIINGFSKSKEVLQKWIKQKNSQKNQNRIVMLTDVGDDSLMNQKDFLESTAEKDNIHTTIIGISTDFKSQICQHFKDIKGFNYFCAVEENDIKKYVFETFDFGFFPTAHNIRLELQTQNIAHIQVFGTPDSNHMKSYKQNSKDQKFWPITYLKSSFPSQIQIHGDTIYTYGGLILIKIRRKSQSSFFKGAINLEYDSIEGQHFNQKYQISYQFHPEQQFFSGEQLRQAIEAYVFTSELKQILKQYQTHKNKAQIWDQYWQTVCKLENLCPKTKLNELQKIKNIIKSFDPKNAKNQ